MGSSTDQEISCRITQTLLLYVRENNSGSLGALLDGLDLDEAYLSDVDNWVSHAFLQVLYHRMIDILHDENAVYKMALASDRFQSLGTLDRIGRLLGNPGLIYAHAPEYNRLLKRNGEVSILESGANWVLLEDCYHRSEQKTRHDCDYTRGIVTGIPTIFGMPLAEVEELACQVAPEKYGRRIWGDSPSYGGKGCLYRIRWNPAQKPPFWKRIFRRHFIYRQAVEDLENAARKIQEKYEEARDLAAHLDAANRELVRSKSQLEAYMSDLKASEQRYRLLAENVTDMIWTFDLATMRFSYFSPSVTKAMGYSQAEAPSTALEQMVWPEDAEMVLQILQEELARDGKDGVDPHRSRTVEFRERRRDGSCFWAEASVSFLRDEEGRPVGLQGVTRDISQRKRAEAERSALERRLQQAHKMEAIGTLAGGIAHDFNNLLMGIQGFTSLMLLELPPDHPNFSRLHHIQDAVRSGGHLTKQLLGFAQAGCFELRPTDMNDIVDHSAEMFGRTKKEISIHTDLEDRLPAVEVDQVQIEQVLLNLYINAWQAMPSGGDLYLETRAEHLEESEAVRRHIPPGDYVRISVRDTGTGIDGEILPRIFEPFFTTKGKGSQKGTGLGLASAYGIVKGHRGEISVESEIGSGTVFRVYLPASKRHASPEKTADEKPLRGTETILLVDDEELIINVTTEILQSLGYRILAARSGREAIDLYRRRRDDIDLVILDMILPGMNGSEIFDCLKKENPGLKAVLSSGYSMDGEAQRILDRGCRAFLQKPFDMQSLSQTVRQVLLQQ